MRGGLVLLGLLVASTGWSADEKKPVVVAAPDEAVVLARQDLDTLKRSGTPLAPSASLGLSLAPPDLSAGPMIALPRALEEPSALKPGQTGNWLVDGVMGLKKDDSRGLSAHEAADRTRTMDREESLRGTLSKASGQASARVVTTDDYGVSDEASPAPDLSRLNAAKPDNPLSQYMSGWISDQDRAVLKPTLLEKTPGLPGVGPPDADTANLDLMVNAKPTEGDRPASALAPTGNPFIDLINTPTTLPVSPEVTYHSPVVSAPAAVPFPAVVPGSKAIIPDYAKGMFDDPALKQAKRF